MLRDKLDDIVARITVPLEHDQVTVMLMTTIKRFVIESEWIAIHGFW